MNYYLVLILVVAGFLAPRRLEAQIAPDLINYQGTLLAGNGTPEPGPKTLEFRIVDEGNAVVWGPQTFEELPLQNGKFNVLLGQADNDGPSVATAFLGDGGDARYLSVRVAGEPTERLPLQRIASVPYAITATTVVDGAITSEKIADGAIIASEIADGAITGAKIADGAVGTNALGNGAVTVAKQAPLQVHTARISGGWAPGYPPYYTWPINGLQIVDLPISGLGRPVFVSLRRVPEQPGTSENLAGDITMQGGDIVDMSCTICIQHNGASTPTRDCLGFRARARGASEGFPRGAVPISPASIQFVVFPDPGKTSLSLSMTASSSTEGTLLLSERLEMYAFEM